jgi:signal transduction histidine kinase
MTRARWALDVASALVAAAATLALLAAHGFGAPDVGARDLDLSGAGLALLCGLPLVVQRRHPMLAFLLTSVASVDLVRLAYPLDAPFGPLVATYALASATGGESPDLRRRLAMLAPAGFIAVTTVAYLAGGRGVVEIGPSLLFWLLVLTGVWITGDRAQLRRARIVELEEQAVGVRREATRERRLAAAEERTRIARELHDSAGHAINVILVQAAAARLLRDRDPHGSQLALATVEQVARSTLGEIDRLVRALREDGELPPAPADPSALQQLLDQHRVAGLQVDCTIPPSQPDVPVSVSWATYRIVQEALTNAAKHGSGTADLSIAYEPDAVHITMTNPATACALGAQARTSGGHGLVGMRERATLLGGSLHFAGTDGVWMLSAVLPYRRATA